MKFWIFLFALGGVFPLQAQDYGGTNYRGLPLVVSVQFHSLALPFHDISFANAGIGLGTEIGFNRSHWVQQLGAVWYRNKAVGNGLLFCTQTAWRPAVGSSGFYVEARAGVGYLYAFRPTESFRQVNGAWASVGRRGKGMLALPAGISAGKNADASATMFSPFISYQPMLVVGYNASVPVVPETLLQLGVRVHSGE